MKLLYFWIELMIYVFIRFKIKALTISTGISIVKYD